MAGEATATDYLKALASRLAATYASHPACRAIILTGSAAEGVSDFSSDLDLILYYEELPAQEELDAARERNGGGERLWVMGDAAEGALFEGYPVGGVECQCGHVTLARWERDMAEVLVHHAVETPLHKAMDGLLHALPLHGEALVRGWQARIAAFPPELAEAMVRHYLSFFPLWSLQGRLGTRDAALWVVQELATTAYNLLGVLAGLNRRYFTTFQFKRLRRFADSLPIAPEHLAERLEGLVLIDPLAAGDRLAALVDETVSLVEQHMPQVDTAKVRRSLQRRAQPWRPLP
jgi:hypothetical protein